MYLLDRAIAATLPLIPRAIVRRVASRYIAGDNIEDALRTAAGLNARGLRATMDILGEDVHREQQARAAALRYRELLKAVKQRGLDSTVSIKLTQVGLKIDKELCISLAGAVLEKAAATGNSVCLDMEDSSCTSDTLEIYARLRRKYANVSVAIQAYLRRTAEDISKLAGPHAAVRLCKGVYIEPETIAYRDMREINRNYIALLDRLLRSGVYVGIATHDESIVAAAEKLLADLRLDSSSYEFQMLLGVGETLRGRLRAAGHPVRVYIPYGSDWYAYSVRRLRENPRLAGYVLKAMFHRQSAKLDAQ